MFIRKAAHSACRVASRPSSVFGLVAFAALVIVASFAAVRFPEPWVPDEFSKLLAGETFALGRFTNPPHPVGAYLESMHVIQWPTYQSKYPPAEGLFLALGRLTGGHPLVGVWLSFVLACGAVAWMMQPWVGTRWALLGGLLLASHAGVARVFGASYAGGGAATLGGALLFGGLPRIIEKPHAGSAALLGLGLVILANSRPFEGLIASLPVAAILAWWVARECRAQRFANVSRAVVPILAVVTLGGLLTARYNYAVTGNTLLMPDQLYQATIASKHLFVDASPDATAARSQGADVWRGIAMLLGSNMARLLFFLAPGILLQIPLALAFRRTVSRPWTGFAWLTFGATLVAASLTFGATHRYLAPAYPLFFLLAVESIRQVRVAFRRMPRAWRLLAALFVFLWAENLWSSLSFHRTPREDEAWTTRRTALVAPLERDDRRHLIVVRRASKPTQNLNWVFNAANIDASKIVWAWDLGDLRPLRKYFEGRRAWLLDLGVTPLALTDLPETTGQIWRLRQHDRGAARMLWSPGNSAQLRTEVTNGGSEAWDVQAETIHPPVRKGVAYSLGFLARADAPRRIRVHLSQAHYPWQNLGLIETVDLNREWHRFDFKFKASADEYLARVAFDLGGSPVSVELNYEASDNGAASANLGSANPGNRR